MSEWLAPVRKALAALQSPVEIYFRDDDAGWNEIRWRRFDIDNYGVLDIDEVVEAVAELHALVGLGGPHRCGI